MRGRSRSSHQTPPRDVPSASTLALQQAGRQSFLWVKHSLQFQGGGGGGVKSNSNHNHNHDNANTPPPRQPSAKKLYLGTKSTNVPFQIETIDEALDALAGYRHEFPVLHQCESNTDHHQDWLLDGHPEWQQQWARTEELMNQLFAGSDITYNSKGTIRSTSSSTSTSNGNRSNHSGDEDAVSHSSATDHLLLTLGSKMGQQEYQFASFEEHPAAKSNEPNANANANTNIQRDTKDDGSGMDDDEDFFGDFQCANNDTASATRSIPVEDPPHRQQKLKQMQPLSEPKDRDNSHAPSPGGSPSFSGDRVRVHDMEVYHSENDLRSAEAATAPQPQPQHQHCEINSSTSSPSLPPKKIASHSSPSASPPVTHEHQQPRQEECTPNPSIYNPNFTTPAKNRIDPNTPITSNNTKVTEERRRSNGISDRSITTSSSSSSSRIKGAESPSRPKATSTKRLLHKPVGHDEKKQDDRNEHVDGDALLQDEPHEVQLVDYQSTEDSPSHEQSSGGVPSVVQVVTTQPSLVVPSTVRLFSNANDGGTPLTTSANTPVSVMVAPTTQSPHHQYNKSLMQPLRLSLQALDRQSSIASNSASSLRSPEGRFLRRTSQMRLLLQDLEDEQDPTTQSWNYNDRNYNDDDSEIDEASLGSLRSLLPEWKSSQVIPSTQEMDQMIVNVLDGLEWEWIPYWKLDRLLQEECDSSFVPLWLDQITQQLSDLDAAHLKISKRLYKLIQPHADELELANRSALDLAKNLQLCQMYLIRSQQSIQLAKYGKAEKIEDGDLPTDGVEGAKQLLNWWDTQESYSDLRGIIDQLSNIYSTEQLILQRIEGFDIRSKQSLEECQSILNMSRELEQRLSTATMGQLDCLQELRDRVGHLRSKTLVARLHSWLESTTIRCCHLTSIEGGGGLDSQEYHRLVQATLLSELQDTREVGGFSKTFCTSIHAALLLEAQKSLGMALLNPSDSENDESEYDKELLALSTKAYLDPSKMAIWTHNLVTIRFDFELSRNHFPAIYHKLCWLLTNALHAHYCFLRWHKTNMHGWKCAREDAAMASIYEELLGCRASIWNTCIKVLEECLEEYLKFSSKKKLFEQTKDGRYDDSAWLDDLLGLEDVSGLTDQFLSLQEEFLGDVPDNFVNDGGILLEKLFDAQKKHLRAFHVQAMNTTGLSLYREDWSLIALSTCTSSGVGVGVVDAIAKAISQEIRKKMTANQSTQSRSRLNCFQSTLPEKKQHLESFLQIGNPFGRSCSGEMTAAVPSSMSSSILIVGEVVDPKISELINSYVGASSIEKPHLPKCFVNGLFPWISRLLLLLEKLPLLAEDISEVFANISDLYVTTAFRVCTGGLKQERILLGLDTPVPSVALARSHGSSSPMFGFARTPPANTSTSNTVVAATTDAEICLPLPIESACIDPVRELVLLAQDKLKNIAKLDLVDKWVPDANPAGNRTLAELAVQSARVLEKRQAALWGCAFLTLTLQLALSIAKQKSGHGAKLNLLEGYVGKLVASIPKMIEIASRFSCIRAIRGRIIVQQILQVGSGWEESKLHEQPNEYVESVCDFTAFLWCSLCNAANLPSGAIQHIWVHVVEGAYASLLDGFSRIAYCSTEGRALMSMDLASFTSDIRGRGVQERLKGHASAPAPPIVSTDRGMAYVDTYIKIFYFPPMDALGWIEDNHSKYQMNHMVALIIDSAVASSEYGTDSIQKLVDRIKGLYCKDKKADSEVTAGI